MTKTMAPSGYGSFSRTGGSGWPPSYPKSVEENKDYRARLAQEAQATRRGFLKAALAMLGCPQGLPPAQPPKSEAGKW
ncbi:MAG TPA: hypothetical protein VG013_23020 [Gemmataceae bacterium]|nr:hypothetical protein [Gemmataceae bacterium]